jgi:hypothetical protein
MRCAAHGRDCVAMRRSWRSSASDACFRTIEASIFTLIGNATTGLLAIAGYGTGHELAIGTVTIEHHDGRPLYSSPGAHDYVASASAVAGAVIRVCRARDARVATDELT